MDPAAMSGVVPALACRALAVSYDEHPVLLGIDLEVADGETVALLGPSGSGKTTFLYAIAGFLDPAGGEIDVRGRRVAGNGRSLPPEERDVAVVFQNYALWPHLTALETVAYPLLRRRVPAAAAEARARELLELMGVSGLAGRRPSALSGGEQQRVGVARALARGAGLVLLDEPTAHLDAPLRTRLLAELDEQRRRSGSAAVYATHDVGEALAVADRVAVLRDGRLVQVASPQAIYERPADEWVAGLTGPASVLIGEVVSVDTGSAVVRLGAIEVSLELAAEASAPRQGPLRLLVRPDWAALGGSLPATVSAALYRGPHTDYRLATPFGELDVREPGPPRAAGGEAVGFELRRAWVLGAAGLSA